MVRSRATTFTRERPAATPSLASDLGSCEGSNPHGNIGSFAVSRCQPTPDPKGSNRALKPSNALRFLRTHTATCVQHSKRHYNKILSTHYSTVLFSSFLSQHAEDPFDSTMADLAVPTPRQQRSRAACTHCRQHKQKCDGPSRNPCRRCELYQLECTYPIPVGLPTTILARAATSASAPVVVSRSDTDTLVDDQ